MKRYCVRKGNDIYFFVRKKDTLQDGLQTTESGNDVTITSYTGSDTDVVVVTRDMSYFCLGRPSTDMKLNVAEYNYTFVDSVATLTKYIGDSINVDTPEPELVDD